MFNDIKPGHVLKFLGTDPATIISPPGATNSALNDNTLIKNWPMVSTLGTVKCISHPSGACAAASAAVAKGMRTSGYGITRGASYSALGQLVTASNRLIGQVNADFVGYVDGESNQIASTSTVFSKDFSGCLMVCYTIAGIRYVAHSAASQVATMDCKQAFLTRLQALGAINLHWFKPYVSTVDVGRKLQAYNVIKSYIKQIDELTTFGVMTSTDQGYSIDAFKPFGAGGNEWVVTACVPKATSGAWIV